METINVKIAKKIVRELAISLPYAHDYDIPKVFQTLALSQDLMQEFYQRDDMEKVAECSKWREAILLSTLDKIDLLTSFVMEDTQKILDKGHNYMQNIKIETLLKILFVSKTMYLSLLHVSDSAPMAFGEVFVKRLLYFKANYLATRTLFQARKIDGLEYHPYKIVFD